MGLLAKIFIYIIYYKNSKIFSVIPSELQGVQNYYENDIVKYRKLICTYYYEFFFYIFQII